MLELRTSFNRIVDWFSMLGLLTFGIFLASIYSTLMSLAWFLISVIRPHWGTFISPNGTINPAEASVLVAGIAKSIEMSFTTIVIACLGQHLTSKAKATGITVNDFQLRTMVLLPGALVTQRGGFRALWRTGMIGGFCIVAYLAAILYTTASDAVVSPHLSVTPLTATNLSAYLQASIANPYYIRASCDTPLEVARGSYECVSTELVGLSYRNYLLYLSNWRLAANEGQDISQDSKPPLTIPFDNNVAVQTEWLYPINYTTLSQQYGRLITGARIAVPYAGLVNATAIPENKLNVINASSDQLIVNARAVTPVLGVTCSVATAEELVPIIYTNWSHTGYGMSAAQFDNTVKSESWRRNATVFDDIFQFDLKTRQRPVFYTIPSQYNTGFDSKGTYRDMAYILLNSNISTSGTTNVSQYTLCGMNITLVGGCSSVYTANSSGKSLALNCDEQNDMAFPENKIEIQATPKDWVNTASIWGRSLSLNGGMIGSDSTLSSILTQMAPSSSRLNPTGPSLADTIAILGAQTLLLSTIDTPFDGIWRSNQSSRALENILPRAVIQKFEAKVQISDYSSGTTNGWKAIFVAELLLVVIINIGCLSYLTYLMTGRLSFSKKQGFRRIPPQKIQEDVTELREIFTIAISSPSVRIIDTPESRRVIHWRYHDDIFKPSNYGLQAKLNGQ